MSGLTVPIMSIGTLIMYTLGSSVPWHIAAAACTPVPVLLGISAKSSHLLNSKINSLKN